MPVGRFEYNPGVQSQAASIYANSNQLFGQMLVRLLEGMGQQREREKNKMEALNLDAKSAQAAFKADLAAAGDDDAAQQKVRQTWGFATPGQEKTISAQDWVGRQKGVVTAEQLISFAQQRQQQQADVEGAKLVPTVLAGAQKLRDTEQPTFSAISGTQNPRKPLSDLLLQSLNTSLTDQQKQTLARSRSGMSLLMDAMRSGSQQDETAAVTARTQGVQAQREADFQQKMKFNEDRANAAQALNDAKVAHLTAQNEALKAGKGLSAKDELGYWKAKQTALLNGSPFHKDDADWQAQLQEADAKVKELIGGAGKPQGASAAKSEADEAPPVPEKSKLVKDQKYTTARGVFTWDGEKFVK
jgi:hypothetical protein